MIAEIPPPPLTAYSLVKELSEPSTVSGVYRIDGDLQTEEALLGKLGARGWGRLHHFRNHYSQPWGETGNAPLSPRALEGLSAFVRSAAFPAGAQPSVFLTDGGGLELVWEDTGGNSSQVEFGPNGVEYFIAKTGEEAAAGWDALPSVIQKMSGE